MWVSHTGEVVVNQGYNQWNKYISPEPVRVGLGTFGEMLQAEYVR